MRLYVIDSIFAYFQNHNTFFSRHPDPESRPTFRDLLIALLKFEDSLVDFSAAWSEEGEDEAYEIYSNSAFLNVEEIYDEI